MALRLSSIRCLHFPRLKQFWEILVSIHDAHAISPCLVLAYQLLFKLWAAPGKISQLGAVDLNVVKFPRAIMPAYELELPSSDRGVAFMFHKNRLFALPVLALK